MVRLQLLEKILKASLRLFGKQDGEFARAHVAEKFGCPVIAINFSSIGTIRFSCPSRWALSRGRRMLSKEPDTIEWIDQFSTDDVFWDIGANVGVYSLYAAAKHKLRVLAFEPSHLNYQTLNLNIAANGFDERVSAFCTCISDICRCEVLISRGMKAGSARHSLKDPGDDDQDEFKEVAKQGILAISIDALVEEFGAPSPNHIKIDVDGMELSVIRGAAKTLRDPRLKSVLIEISEGHNEIRDTMELSGFLFRSCYKKNHIYVRPSWKPPVQTADFSR